MAFARTCSVALVGVDGVIVEVQADLEPGVAAFALVGLPDKALSEARDRVRAAVVNSGEAWPQRKLTVGLSPAAVPKSGSGFDLAVACAVLAAAERLDPSSIADLLIIGELGLDGRVRPVRGVLPSVLAAADAGYQRVVVAEQTAAEASLVPGVTVIGVRSLRQLVAVLTGAPAPEEPPDPIVGRPDPLMAGLMLPTAGVRGLPDDKASASTWPMWQASTRPAEPWRSLPRAVTICTSRARRARGRRCWRSGCRRSCHHSPRRRPWRSPPSTPWRGSSRPAGR